MSLDLQQHQRGWLGVGAEGAAHFHRVAAVHISLALHQRGDGLARAVVQVAQGYQSQNAHQPPHLQELVAGLPEILLKVEDDKVHRLKDQQWDTGLQ